MTDPKPTVFGAWSQVMGAVQAVKKDGFNAQQNFNFRGIDAVMNAVGPALREYGVIVLPTVEDIQVERYTTGRNNTAMKNVTVRMRYTVHGPAGDSFSGVTFGEASDSSDKAVAKAQAVAYRVFLLQGLTIPTDDPDPDASTDERNPINQEAIAARDELAELCEQLGIPLGRAVRDFANATGGLDLRDPNALTDPAPIRTIAERYRTESQTPPADEPGPVDSDAP